MPYGSGKAAYMDANSLASLTSEQALADFATLVIDLKKNLSAEASPVVLFGGSYGGSKPLSLHLLRLTYFPCFR
jgi:lysosomal Pro-X carboxypeptidase